MLAEDQLAPTAQLDLFSAERWPRKPYCTDELGSMHIRTLSHARRHRYIQPNAPAMIFRLVYDIDRPGAALAWDDAGVAPASWSATNTENAHAHLGYEIAVPIVVSPNARMAPVRLAAAIERAYTEALGADEGYAGLLCKNPLHPDWQTQVWRPEPYDLAELAEYVDLTRFNDRRRRPRSGIGRNVDLFDRLRAWAYANIRHHWQPAGLEPWAATLLSRAEAFNDFAEPLPFSEIKATARSIARWTWANMTPASFREYIEKTHSSASQSRRGRKSGEVRRQAADERAAQARAMAEAGAKQRDIAERLGVTARTVRNWLKAEG